MSDQRGLVNQPGQNGPPHFLYTHLRPSLAEFLGTTFFIFLGTMATVNGGDLVSVALGHALALTTLVAAMANISGSHFNPAVTLGLCLTRDISPAKAAMYVASQVLGGITGSGLTKAILPRSTYIRVAGGGQTLADGVTAGEGMACEVFLTAILVLVILMTAVDAESKVPWAPIAIGFTVGADILAGGPISGASMNPARSFGPAVVASSMDEISGLWDYHYVYWLGPAIGAAFSALWYRLVLACPEKNFLFRSPL